MTRLTKLSFQVAAFALIITGLLAIAALAARLGGTALAVRLGGGGLAITTSMFMPMVTTYFCVWVGIAEERRRIGRRGRARMSIKEELDLRRRRAEGARIQFR